jgi:hypothetical protein
MLGLDLTQVDRTEIPALSHISLIAEHRGNERIEDPSIIHNGRVDLLDNIGVADTRERGRDNVERLLARGWADQGLNDLVEL